MYECNQAGTNKNSYSSRPCPRKDWNVTFICRLSRTDSRYDVCFTLLILYGRGHKLLRSGLSILNVWHDKRLLTDWRERMWQGKDNIYIPALTPFLITNSTFLEERLQNFPARHDYHIFSVKWHFTSMFFGDIVILLQLSRLYVEHRLLLQTFLRRLP